MKISRFIPVIIIPLLFSCLPKKPEIPMTEVPAGPLMQALKQRGDSFSSLKALAGIKTVRKDRRRSFDSVGILVKEQERFRIEVYGQLGETLMTLLWNGKEMLLDLPDQRRVLPTKNPLFERLLGADLHPGELSVILSGNIPGAASAKARLLCAQNNSCVLELRSEDRLVRAYPAWGPEEAKSTISSYDMYQREKFVYRVKFESFEQVSGYALPKRIIVENPEKRMSLIVEYAEAEVNVPLDLRAFVIPGAEGSE